MKMMLKFSILQMFKINIGKHFCMNTSMSGTQQQMLLHVKMLKVHQSSYLCQRQSKHDQSNV